MFTPKRRQAIYGVIASLTAAAIAFGLIAETDADTILQVATQVLAIGSLLMARSKVPEAPDAG